MSSPALIHLCVCYCTNVCHKTDSKVAENGQLYVQNCML